jgi:hypothetical protein
MSRDPEPDFNRRKAEAFAERPLTALNDAAMCLRTSTAQAMSIRISTTR